MLWKLSNVHAFSKRIPVLSLGCLGTAALLLLVCAGTSCNFVKVVFESQLTSSDGFSIGGRVGGVGILCENDLSDESDRMWKLSNVFFVVSAVLGGITVLMAWALGFCIPPRLTSWRLLSVLSAITAILQVPMFLLYEIDMCSLDSDYQSCSFDSGSYLSTISIVFFAILSLAVQLFDPPDWSEEIEAWKVDKDREKLEGTDTESSETQKIKKCTNIENSPNNHDGFGIGLLIECGGGGGGHDDNASRVSSISIRDTERSGLAKGKAGI